MALADWPNAHALSGLPLTIPAAGIVRIVSPVRNGHLPRRSRRWLRDSLPPALSAGYLIKKMAGATVMEAVQPETAVPVKEAEPAVATRRVFLLVAVMS